MKGITHHYQPVILTSNRKSYVNNKLIFLWDCKAQYLNLFVNNVCIYTGPTQYILGPKAITLSWTISYIYILIK